MKTKWNIFHNLKSQNKERNFTLKKKQITNEELEKFAKPYSTVLMYPEMTKKQLSMINKQRSASHSFIPFRKL